MIDYYDRLLIVIGAVMIAGVAVSVHPSVAVYEGLAGGSLISTFVLYEILFRNPPIEPTRARTAASVVVGTGWLLTVVAFL